MLLSECREKIDEIDKELVALFIKRMDICKTVAEYKRENNLPVFDEKREEALLSKVQKNAGEKFGKYTRELYRHIMDISKEYEEEVLCESCDKND